MNVLLLLITLVVSLFVALYFSNLGGREARRQHKNVTLWKVLCFFLGPLALWFLYPAPLHDKLEGDAEFTKQGYQVLGLMLGVSLLIALYLWVTGRLY